MRRTVRVASIAAGLLALAACADPRPPVGRWQGAYDDPGLIIVARLEIDADGNIRVSAPNAITDDAPPSNAERAAIKARLESGLAQSWPSVLPLELKYDGKAFHKPGGVAPQLEWDEKAKRMTLIFYSGNRRSVHVPLHAVSDFGAS